jgi:hypothetical protein
MSKIFPYEYNMGKNNQYLHTFIHLSLSCIQNFLIAQLFARVLTLANVTD